MHEPRKHPELSKREQQLITLATGGLTDIAISIKLGISESTVKSYWGRVRSKLGPYNRTELVSHALKEERARAVAKLNEEIARLHDALRESGLRALDLQQEHLEDAPDAVFAVDNNGCFVWINRQAQVMFGFEYSEVVGKHLGKLIPAEYNQDERDLLQEFFQFDVKLDAGASIATTGLRKNGETFHIAATYASMETPNGRIVTCFVRDVSVEVALASYAEQYGTSVD